MRAKKRIKSIQALESGLKSCSGFSACSAIHRLQIHLQPPESSSCWACAHPILTLGDKSHPKDIKNKFSYWHWEGWKGTRPISAAQVEGECTLCPGLWAAIEPQFKHLLLWCFSRAGFCAFWMSSLLEGMAMLKTHRRRNASHSHACTVPTLPEGACAVIFLKFKSSSCMNLEKSYWICVGWEVSEECLSVCSASSSQTPS